MTVSIQPRNLAQKQTLAQAVQGVKPPAQPAPTDMTGGAPRQEPTTETTPAPVAATPAQEKKDDFLSPKFAALARQEKAIRAERERLKRDREALEAEKSARLNGYIPKDAFKTDPLAALEQAGLSYDDLAQRLLNSPQGQVDPTVRAMQAKIEELTGKLNSLSQKQEETQTTAYKQAVETIRHKVKGVVESAPEEFELIKALDQSEAVVALIEETFKAEGYVMTEEEAAREVEEHLFEEATRMAGLEKIRKKLSPAAPTPQTEPEKQHQPQQQQTTTLSNAHNATTPRRLTERERRERAILAAQGKLTN